MADALVIGSGPNGLAAAIELTRAGCSVTVYEAADTLGGGMRSAALTLPGFLHDVCSAIHPLALSSPFFRNLPLSEHGLEWVHPQAAVAHPLDDGGAVLLERDVETTVAGLEQDAAAWRSIFVPLGRNWAPLLDEILAPPHLPRHPMLLAHFGMQAMRSAAGFARSRFRGRRARALFAGLAGHSMLPLERAGTAAFGLVLAAAGHAVGWPLARGGSQRLAEALASYLRSLGGRIETGRRIHSLDELPPARAILCDITPRQLLRLAGDRLPPGYRRRLQQYRYGMAAFKLDWALSQPIPWKAAECRRAATVHLGGTLEEIQESERAPFAGRHAERPFVLLAQPTLFDPSRAPAGKHTAWAYCHVPHASTEDVAQRIENQVERFAPGFRQCVRARSVLDPAALERHNANLVGGDINGGMQDLRQMFARPTLRMYSTPLAGLYLCSASTPPGGGVHGMCGYFAARTALRRIKN